MRLRSGFLCAIAALAFAFAPAPAQADFTATLNGTAATFTGDPADDALTIRPSLFVFAHNRFAEGDAGFESELDFDSAEDGVQVLPIGATSLITADAGGGSDTVVANYLNAGDIESQVTSTAIEIPGQVEIRYANPSFEEVRVLTGEGDDEIDVTGAAAARPTLLQIGGGANRVTVGNGSLDSIESPVRVALANADDEIIADDSDNDDPHLYLLQTSGLDDGFLRDDQSVLLVGSLQPTSLELRGGEGDDRIIFFRSGSGSELAVDAGAGDDLGEFQQLQDTPEHVQATTIAGGAGTDRLDYSHESNAVRALVDLAAKTGTAITGDVVGWEDVVGGALNDQLRGNGGRNRLTGGPGRDRLQGAGGNDRLTDVQGRRNRLDCGRGRRDVAIAKRSARIKRSCERVRRR